MADPSIIDRTVRTTTGVYNAIGSIGTFLTVLSGVVIAYIKFGPKWKEIAVSSDKAELDVMSARIATLETKIEEAVKQVNEAKDNTRAIERKAEERVHKVELQLRSALNACRVLLNYVEREHSSAPEVSLAKELLAIAVTDDLGISQGIDRIVNKMGGS